MIYYKALNIPVPVKTIYPHDIIGEVFKYNKILSNLYNHDNKIRFSQNNINVHYRYLHIAKNPRMVEFPIYDNLICKEVKDWLKELGLCLINGVLHNRSPNTKTVLHIDFDGKVGDVNVPKLNFIFSSYNANMKWFKLKPNTEGNGDGVSTQFSEKNITLEYECIADSHCILNGGEIHMIEVGNNRGIDRVCYSYWLARIPDQPNDSFDIQKNLQPIDWDTCIEIFKPYFKD